MIKKKKSWLSNRITWRVLLIIGCFNVFIIGAVILFDLAISHFESEMRAQHMMEGIDGKLLTMLRAVEVAAKNSVAEMEVNLDSPEKVFDALEHEFLLNNRYLGGAVAFEPDYFASQGRWFEPYVRLIDSTHVERKQIGSAQHDYLKQEWYQKGFSMERGHGYLSDPYLDKDGGKCILSTYVLPIFDRQGRKVGVFGLDINLDWLKHTIASEENKVRMMSFKKKDPKEIEALSDMFFIQLFDSKGWKIAGSGTIDDETLKTIQKSDSIGFKKMKMNGTTYYIGSQRLGSTGWTLVVAQHEHFVLLYGYLLAFVISLFMIIGGIVIFLFTSLSIRRAITPLHYLSKSAHEVAQGNFDTRLPTFKHQDEIALLRDSFDTMQQSLKGYVEELKASTAAKASIESELSVARGIQMSMLPKIFPPFPHRDDIELYAVQNPAKAVGGDLYDFFIRDEMLFFCIGDVSGKGVPASLVMAVTRTLFRNVAVHTDEPSRIVVAMNEAICEGNDNHMFVTMFVGVLDLHTGHLRYSNAGHDAPYRMNGEKLACDSNLPVGVMPDWKYSEQEATLATDETVFLYTDGLTEAENALHEQFGEDRITDIVSSFKGLPQELIETITDAVNQFVGDTEQSDDLTMLAFKYTKQNISSAASIH
jgi:sigma-B regulation protein RsbU (phosphoserine phosphatase)